ncbi:MAG: phosphoribosylanthranilate isomerase [Rhodospirillaceae bacterium]|jgi:phosphoribosylanthranilate isomerase|nr:phosphoribosylanthranilate isomerase [Rhodospirillaceae bacterium]MBT5459942.1 phosphoribosylanthranilate isomerase [Rhodospirillaceae bacterium]
MSVQAKICGINSEAAMGAAVEGSADYVGLVFYAPSPRAVTAIEAAELVRQVPDDVIKVGLFVDMDDATFSAILSQVTLDLLQLHGAETPERVAEIHALTGLPVMKAIKVAGAQDIEAADRYLDCADRLLFDAKAPPDLKGALPGGNALMFDWTLLAGRDWPCPWMLSGGLDADNVAEAVSISGALAVDVSSGVEQAPGVKDPARISAFLSAVKAL